MTWRNELDKLEAQQALAALTDSLSIPIMGKMSYRDEYDPHEEDPADAHCYCWHCHRLHVTTDLDSPECPKCGAHPDEEGETAVDSDS